MLRKIDEPEDTRITTNETCIVCDVPSKSVLCGSCYADSIRQSDERMESHFDIDGRYVHWFVRLHTRVKCKIGGCRCCLVNIRAVKEYNGFSSVTHCASCKGTKYRRITYLDDVKCTVAL